MDDAVDARCYLLATAVVPLACGFPDYAFPSGGPEGGPAEGGVPDANVPEGAVDAGVQDGAPDARPPSTCADAGVLLCEGFEDSGALNHAVWSPNEQGGTITVDTSFAFRGEHSMRAHLSTSPAADGTLQAEIDEGLVAPPASGAFFMRAWIYVGPSVPGPTRVLSAQAANGAAIELYIYPDATAVVQDRFTSPANRFDTSVQLPTEQWVCVELEVDTTSPNGVRLWMNDAAQLVADGGAMQTTPNLSSVWIGAGDYSAQTPPAAPFDLWIDEVMLDRTFIPCAK